MNSESDHPKLSIASDVPPVDVPTFPCIVYVSAAPQGGVHARVANLPGIAVDAESERAALGKIVPEFKRRVGEITAKGEPVPWIDPPPQPASNEEKRFVPVHL